VGRRSAVAIPTGEGDPTIRRLTAEIFAMLQREKGGL
jgi:hypothetical protein